MFAFDNMKITLSNIIYTPIISKRLLFIVVLISFLYFCKIQSQSDSGLNSDKYRPSNDFT